MLNIGLLAILFLRFLKTLAANLMNANFATLAVEQASRTAP